MDIRKWIVAHFSPTGGTKKVADAIAAGFGTPVAEVDLTKAVPAMTPAEGEALVAVLPVYAGRVPKIALERLSAIKGQGHKAVAVVVYGNHSISLSAPILLLEDFCQLLGGFSTAPCQP
jgi:flavodoxin